MILIKHTVHGFPFDMWAIAERLRFAVLVSMDLNFELAIFQMLLVSQLIIK